MQREVRPHLLVQRMRVDPVQLVAVLGELWHKHAAAVADLEQPPEVLLAEQREHDPEPQPLDAAEQRAAIQCGWSTGLVRSSADSGSSFIW